MSKRTSIVDELRRAIRAAEKRGTTRYKLSLATGVSEAQLSRIYHRQIEPKASMMERILSGLGKRLAIVDR
jgi:predicted transcriptional regulator